MITMAILKQVFWPPAARKRRGEIERAITISEERGEAIRGKILQIVAIVNGSEGKK